MERARLLAVLLLASGLPGACHGQPAAPDAVVVSGTWEATFQGIVQGTGSSQTDDLTLELSQSGTTVTGFIRDSPIEVPISRGQIVGSRLTYSAVTSLEGCEIRLEADLIVDPSGTRLAGSQTQSTCEGTAVGQLTATKNR